MPETTSKVHDLITSPYLVEVLGGEFIPATDPYTVHTLSRLMIGAFEKGTGPVVVDSSLVPGREQIVWGRIYQPEWAPIQATVLYTTDTFRGSGYNFAEGITITRSLNSALSVGRVAGITMVSINGVSIELSGSLSDQRAEVASTAQVFIDGYL